MTLFHSRLCSRRAHHRFALHSADPAVRARTCRSAVPARRPAVAAWPRCYVRGGGQPRRGRRRLGGRSQSSRPYRGACRDDAVRPRRCCFRRSPTRVMAPLVSTRCTHHRERAQARSNGGETTVGVVGTARRRDRLCLGAVRRPGDGIDPDRSRTARPERRDLVAAADLCSWRRHVARRRHAVRPQASCTCQTIVAVGRRSSPRVSVLQSWPAPRSSGSAPIPACSTRLSSTGTTVLERGLIATLRQRPAERASARAAGDHVRDRSAGAAAIAVARASRG